MCLKRGEQFGSHRETGKSLPNLSDQISRQTLFDSGLSFNCGNSLKLSRGMGAH